MFLKRRASVLHSREGGVVGLLSRRRGVILGAALAVSALALLATHREGAGVRGQPVALLSAPAQTAVDAFAGSVESVVDRYFLLVGAREEATRLRREVADLRRELSAVGEISLENRRLKTLLNFKESTDLPLLPARVVGRSASAWFRTLVVDKGSAEGVSLNSPVVTADGVIGRVYQVSPGASRVLLITDTSSAVDAVVQRTRAQVIVEGRLGPSCRLLYLARNDEAAVGDRVVTSGLGDVYPKGLLIGQIYRVEPAKGGVFRAADLNPAVDLTRLEEVFVVLPRRGATR